MRSKLQVVRGDQGACKSTIRPDEVTVTIMIAAQILSLIGQSESHATT